MIAAMHVATGRAWRSIAEKGDKAREDGSLHASDLTGCLRQQHYAYNKVKKTDPHAPTSRTRAAAFIGTQTDKGFIPELARHLRGMFPASRVRTHPTATIEVSGVRFKGTPDIRIDWPDNTATIVDMKTLGRARYDQVRQKGVILGHKHQASIHAVMAELHKGVTVTSLLHFYLDRDSPDSYPGYHPRMKWFETEFSSTLRSGADRRVRVSAAAAKSIVHAPRWFRSLHDAQRDNSPCVVCPWRTECLS